MAEKIKLIPGVDKCPNCGNLFIVERVHKTRNDGDGEDVCHICTRSVWWLEWYAARKKEAGR